MQKILSLRQYQKTYAETSRPALKTLRRRCKLGQVPGAYKEGGRWYVKTELPTQQQPIDPFDELERQAFADVELNEFLRA